MNRVVLCTFADCELLRIQDLFEMRSAIESILFLFNENNKHVINETALYEKAIADLSKNTNDLQVFWSTYYKKYNHIVKTGDEIWIDYGTKELFYISKD